MTKMANIQLPAQSFTILKFLKNNLFLFFLFFFQNITNVTGSVTFVTYKFHRKLPTFLVKTGLLIILVLWDWEHIPVILVISLVLQYVQNNLFFGWSLLKNCSQITLHGICIKAPSSFYLARSQQSGLLLKRF